MREIFIIVLILFFITSINAQDKESHKDIKVGLVLSGGGAKGLAHIGALRALEEAGVRVDYIGGTSMGAIIGGLYASGYSVYDIENIVRNLDFNTFNQEDISRKSKPFFQKENEHKYIVKLSLKDNKIQLPSGLTDGQSVLNSLSKYTQHISHIKDFSKLPIPFLCIATDLEKGEQVILDSGYLPDAIRASASFPTLLKPVEIDDKLLIDGGIVNNFPVDEVRAMGADVIIGVDVSEGELLKKEDIHSVVDVLNQVMSYQMTEAADLAKKEKTTVYIRPDISSYSLLSFDEFEKIVELGYETSMLQLSSLLAIAQQQNKKKKTYKAPEVPEEFTINSIQITGNTNFSYAYISEKLQLKIGKQITFDDFFNGIGRLSATDNFTRINHKIHLTEDGKFCNINIKVVENSIKTHLKVGLHYDKLYKASALLNITSKNLLLGNDFISADIILGEKPRYNITYFVDNGVNLSVGLNSLLQNFDFKTDFYSSDGSLNPSFNFVDLDYLDISNSLFVQAVYRDNFAIGVGAEHRYLKVTSENNLPNTDGDKIVYEKSNFLNPFTYITFDTFDAKDFPKSGLVFNAHAQWHMSSDNYQENFTPFAQGLVKVGFANTIGEHFTIQLNSEVGVTLGENENPYLGFRLGGYSENPSKTFTSFHGYPFSGLGDNSYLKSTVNLRYEVVKNHYLSSIVNIARIEDNVFKNADLFSNIKSGFAIQYGIKTFAGPVSLTYSYSPQVQKNYWNINIGYWF